MIDHLFGRPSPSWKRVQVFLVIFFWVWRIIQGHKDAPRLLWLRSVNRYLKRFTPWQIIVSTLTGVYAIRNLDKILGLNAPEPLARLYSPSYYRATWITTGLDAGFASALSIRPKWLRDISSILFSAYYVIYANEADEKLRKFRAVPTVEMLRATWEKTTNPYLRFFTPLPPITLRRKILLPRPKSSTYTRPITAYLFFHNPNRALSETNELILDFPGGGFVAMTPEHHEERLRLWAGRTGRTVLSIDYGKAPEYPYPFAIDEAYDVYRLLVESAGQIIGISGKDLKIIFSGDSAGAAIAVNVVFKILENHTPTPTSIPSVPLPLPLALVLSYSALDFNFTSWMTPANLQVLRLEQEQQESGGTELPGLKELVETKDHLRRISVLSMVPESKQGERRRRNTFSASRRLRRRTSWKETFRGFGSGNEDVDDEQLWKSLTIPNRRSRRNEEKGILADDESESDREEEEAMGYFQLREEDRPIQARVRFVPPQSRSQPQPPGLQTLGTYSTTICLSPVNNDRLSHHKTGGSDTLDLRREDSFPRSGSALERRQEELSVAVAEADYERKEGKRREEPVGTRLTMTSRAGYFSDRIVSPTMMRSMALLYLGPHRNPDFSTDYRVSPILAPDRLLAQFPPLLMQCGEKDPFVDDTVIFAGRVREAKRARLAELEKLIRELEGGREKGGGGGGGNVKVGEGLRMTSLATEKRSFSENGKRSELANLKKERARLAGESEEDWVQLDLFSDWSHGYLQMPMLMSEVKGVIEDLGDWIDDAFGRLCVSPSASPKSTKGETREVGQFGAVKGGRKSSPPQGPGPTSGHERRKSSSPTNRTMASVRASNDGAEPRGPEAVSETETETETDDARITFVPKRHSNSNSTSNQGPRSSQHVRVGSSTTNSNSTVAETSSLVESLEPFVASRSEGDSPILSSSGSEATLDGGERTAGRHGININGRTKLDDTVAVAMSGSPPKGAVGKAGPLISETELMRRRRLLDAHIFD